MLAPVAAALVWLAAVCLSGCGGGGGGGTPRIPSPGGGDYSLAYAGLLDGNSAANSPANADGWEQVRDIAVDSAGNIYLTGGTTAADFPVTPGAWDTSFNSGGSTTGSEGYTDAFVTKLDSAGNLVWSTFFGGPNYDRAYAIELDNAGNIYIAGRAGAGLPVTAGVVQTAFGGGANSGTYGSQDGFVAKFSPAGNLLWASYFGAGGPGIVRDIAVEPATGVIHVAATMGAPLPAMVTNGSTFRGPYDGVYTRLSTDGKSVLFGTYLGSATGSADFLNPSVQLDMSGNAVVQAYTDATDIAIPAGHYQTTNAGQFDIVVYKISAGGAVAPCTYYGGSADEDMETHQLGLDNLGNIYISGRTRSTDLPVISGGVQTSAGGGGSDGFIAKLSADCTRLLAATYLGGAQYDDVEGLVVTDSPELRVYVSGSTASTAATLAFPGGVQSDLAGPGSTDAYTAVLDQDLSRLYYGTWLGGSFNDLGRAIAVAPDGDIATGGQTQSADFPTSNAFDSHLDAVYGATYVRLNAR